MATTHHAQARTQQRGIPQMLIDLLLMFGKREAAGSGLSKIFFDKRGRRRVQGYAGPLGSLINQYLDVYAVVTSDDTVITIAHRFERIKRH